MKNILVIGGAGFIGSHVADHLTNANYNVTIFDKVESQWLKKNQKMIIGDILDNKILSKSMDKIDAVYNFAGLSDLNQALEKPIDTVNLNILGNVNILESARKNKVKRYVYASSIYTYSRDGGFYKCSKKSAELYIEEYKKTYNLDYTILRFGSLYGPRSDSSNGLWQIIDRALKIKKIKYEGNQESIREYIHVEDAARACLECLSDNFLNQKVVLTGQNEMKVRDMLKTLAEILDLPDNSIEVVENDQRGHYIRTPYAYQSDIGLKYRPTLSVDFGQGLLQLIEDLKERQ